MKFISSINYFVWLAISAIFFAFGEFLSKKFALNPKIIYIFCIIIIYTIADLAWLPAIMQKNQLSIVGVMWSVLGLVATVLIGTIIFGEKLSAAGLAGICVAIVAVVLLSI